MKPPAKKFTTKAEMKKVAVMFPASLAPEIKEADERHLIWARQREERGFDSTEIWNLDVSFARLMLPRVEAYVAACPFVKDKHWRADMRKIVKALRLMKIDDPVLCSTRHQGCHP